MGISRMNSTPLYAQLKNELQDQILMGDLAPGVLLPTEQQLCDQFNLSRITVRRALKELADIDLIESKGQGFNPGCKLLEQEVVTGSPSLHALFDLPEVELHQFWRFRRLRFINDEPTVIMNTFVRKELGDRMLEYDIGNSSFYSLYGKITGRELIDSRAFITAVSASPEVAKLLNTYTGAPLIWFRGVTLTEGSVPIEVNYSLFLGDRYQFETTFYRPLKINPKEFQG